MFSNVLIYIIDKIYGTTHILPECLIDIISDYSWEYTVHKNLIKMLSKINIKDENNYSLLTKKLNTYMIKNRTSEIDYVFLINNMNNINFTNIYDNQKLIKNNKKELKELLLTIL